MATIAVLAPMRTELRPVVRRLGLQRDPRDEAGPETWSGRCAGHDVIAAVAGVGTRHAAMVAEQVIDRVRPDHVVVVGVAGGLAPHLEVGDLVVPALVHDLDDGTSHRAAQLGDRPPEGELVTSAVLHGWDVLQAHADAGVLAVDMETSAVAAACERAGRPWSAIRALSDVVREGTVDASSLTLVREDGETDPAGVVRLLLRHPTRVRSLAAMGKAAGRATAAAAAELERALAGTPPAQASGMGADAR